MSLRVRGRTCLSYVAVLVLILPFGCARLSPIPGSLPFSQEEAGRLIAALDEAGEETTSFQGFGKVRFKDGEEESESNLLVVGCRPFKVRLEISHPWGKPLVHIVVDEEDISIVSLIEKKFFRGHSNPLAEYYFFLLGLDLSSAWKILSGRVPILLHSRAASMKPNEITLYDDGGEAVETISFLSAPLLPRSVTFPKKGITVMLSDFKRGDQGLNPMKIQAVKTDDHRLVEIRYKNLRHDKPVPKEIFHLNPPPNFDVIELNE